MKNLLLKEMKLALSPLSFLFIAFSFLTFCPGYPILVGGFFVCLGMYQSFLSVRENNDILYTALLPVRKADAVRAKYLSCLVIEGCAFLIGSAVTLLRMTLLSDVAAYRSNVMMNANLVFLGWLLLLYGCFNAIFICGFFRTAYRIGRPFIVFIIVAFLIVGIGETLIHIPGLSALNAFGFDHIGLQLGCLAAGLAAFLLLTLLSEKTAERYFEKIDLH